MLVLARIHPRGRVVYNPEIYKTCIKYSSDISYLTCTNQKIVFSLSYDQLQHNNRRHFN